MPEKNSESAGVEEKLRIMVAQAKGWEVWEQEDYKKYGLPFPKEDGPFYGMGWKKRDTWDGDLFWQDDHPKWSTDIRDAMKLFVEMGDKVHLRHEVKLGAAEGQVVDAWYCSFVDPVWYAASSPEKAICLAWLEWNCSPDKPKLVHDKVSISWRIDEK